MNSTFKIRIFIDPGKRSDALRFNTGSASRSACCSSEKPRPFAERRPRTHAKNLDHSIRAKFGCRARAETKDPPTLFALTGR